MSTHEISRLTFQLTHQTEVGNELSYLKSFPSADSGLVTTKLLGEAVNLEDASIEKLVTGCEYLEKALKSNYTFEIVEVVVSTSTTPVDLKGEAFVEERRRRAFAKLSIKDIEALGVSGLAIYNKLKFHGAEEQ